MHADGQDRASKKRKVPADKRVQEATYHVGFYIRPLYYSRLCRHNRTVFHRVVKTTVTESQLEQLQNVDTFPIQTSADIQSVQDITTAVDVVAFYVWMGATGRQIDQLSVGDRERVRQIRKDYELEWLAASVFTIVPKAEQSDLAKNQGYMFSWDVDT